MSYITEDYYSSHSEEYIEETIHTEMDSFYSFFEKYLPLNGKKILDIGFGSGRDSLYFQNKGYEVTSLDQCEEFCQHGKEIGLKRVIHKDVMDMDFHQEFDGIWACASLLHVSSDNLGSVFRKCALSLKDEGVMYCSFKYGDFEGERTGRYYHDLTEDSLAFFLVGTGLEIKEIRITTEQRKTSEVKWVNVILTKK